MRRFTLTTILLALALTIAVSVYEKEETPLSRRLEQAMAITRMRTYHDKVYDYTVRYPSFFEQTPDTLLDEPGHCRFSFWQDHIQIVQTTFVEPNPDALSVEEGMRKYAIQYHATRQRKEKDGFILSGPLYINGSLISGHHFHVKYVRHRKLWFVTLLTYPEDCEKAVRRLIRQIDDWQVW